MHFVLFNATKIWCDDSLTRRYASMDNLELDVVYIVRPGDYNPMLQFSLRSLVKYTSFRKLWIVGYAPDWLCNINYLPVPQNGSIWANSTNNVIQACNCDGISDNFVLMNDDFFALRPIADWEETTNYYRGSISRFYEIKATTNSKWVNAFHSTDLLLRGMGITSDQNWEMHIPTIFNKEKFMQMICMPTIIDFRKKHPVFLKRTVYHNLFPNEVFPKIQRDPKLAIKRDLTANDLTGDWLSSRVNTVRNDGKYVGLNTWLKRNYPDKCRYET